MAWLLFTTPFVSPDELDGSANAPTGTANFPNLLDSYSFTPSWQVAGVDYRVGINTGVTLKNPAVDTLPTNCTRDIPGTNFFMNGTTVVDGWDFSGWDVQWIHGTGSVVRNCKFDRGALTVLQTVNGGDATDGTIEYCYFEQGYPFESDSQCVNFQGGNWTYQYNHFKDALHMAMQMVGKSTGNIWNIRWNLIENTGVGAPDGAHGDFIQIFGDNEHDVVHCHYNTVIHTLATISGQGWSVNAALPIVHSGSFDHNTMLITRECNYVHRFAINWMTGTVDVVNNYADMTGVSQAWIHDGDDAPGPFNGTINVANNVNMITGSAIT